MLTRIQKALHDKRDDEGFTLIELLVVMIIIGILVAIAIPIFLNQKKKAYETSEKADVKQLSTNVETALTDGDIYDVVVDGATGTITYNLKSGDASTAQTIDMNLSNGNTVKSSLTFDAATKALTAYCVEVDHSGVNPWKFSGNADGSSGGGLQQGAC